MTTALSGLSHNSGPGCLLFFDTFSHEGVELNVDLVQFPNPVAVREVRVIPTGARVQTRLNALGVGATTPSSFSLELFVNDLTHPGSATFARLGTMYYDADSTLVFRAQKRIPTDGLVLRGVYNQITLAIVGDVSHVTADQLMHDQNSVHPASEEAVINSMGMSMHSEPSVNDEMSPVSTLSGPQSVSALQPPSISVPMSSMSSARPPPSVPLASPVSLAAPIPSLSSPVPSLAAPIPSLAAPVPSLTTPMPPLSTPPLSNGLLLPPSFSRPPPPLPPMRFDQPPPNMMGRLRPRPRGRRPHLHRQPAKRVTSAHAITTSVTSPTMATTAEDALDNVSDISDGDIPEMDDVETEDSQSKTETPVVENNEDSTMNETAMPETTTDNSTELMEEISDDEANWSDMEADEEEKLLQDVWDDDNDLICVFDPNKARLPPPKAKDMIAEEDENDDDIKTCLQSIVNACCANCVTLAHVEQLEQMRALLKTRTSVPETILCLFIEIIKHGLDMERVNESTVAKICVRHVKAVLNLTRSMALQNLLTDVALGELEELIELLLRCHIKSHNSALPLKLLGLSTLDAILAIPKLSTEPFVASKPYSELYTSLLRVMIESTSRSRLRAAIEELLGKIHFVQIGNEFKATLMKNNGSSIATVMQRVRETCKALVISLNDCQTPKNLLPLFDVTNGAKSQIFEWKLKILENQDIMKSIYQVLRFEEKNIEDTSMTRNCIVEAYQLLSIMSSEPKGLEMMCLNYDATNKLLSRMLEDDHWRTMGGKLSSIVHAHHNLSSLRDERDEVVVQALQKLFGMTFVSVGHRKQVANVIVREFETMLKVAEDVKERQSMFTALVYNYIGHLLLFGLKHCDCRGFSLPPSTQSLIKSFLKSYDDVKDDEDLRDDTESPNPVENDMDIREQVKIWLGLVKEASSADIASLCDRLKKSIDIMAHHVEEKEQEEDSLCSPQFVWPLKVLMPLMDGEHNLVKVYRTGVMEPLFQWMTRLCDTLDYNVLTRTLTNSTYLLASCLRIAVRLWRDIWRLIIVTRDKQFKDTTRIELAARLYCLLDNDNDDLDEDNGYSRRVDEEDEDDLKVTRLDLFSILTSYTLSSGQPTTPNEFENDVWTTMVRRLLELMLSRPYRFRALLSLLCDLLPSALPLEGCENVDSESQASLRRSRNLWSLHLYPLREDLASVINTTVFVVVDVRVRSLGLKLCHQLADCSIPMAETVFDAIMKNIDENVENDKLLLIALDFVNVFIGRLAMHLRACLLSWANQTERLNPAMLITSLQDKSDSTADAAFQLLQSLFDPYGPPEEFHASLPMLSTSQKNSITDALMTLMTTASEIKVVMRSLHFLNQIGRVDEVVHKRLKQRRSKICWLDVFRKLEHVSDDIVADFFLELLAFLDLDVFPTEKSEALNLTMNATANSTSTEPETSAATATTTTTVDTEETMLDSFISRARLVMEEASKDKVSDSQIKRLEAFRKIIENNECQDMDESDKNEDKEMVEDKSITRESLLTLFSERPLTTKTSSHTCGPTFRVSTELQLELDVESLSKKCLGDSFDLQSELRRRHVGSHELSSNDQDNRSELERRAVFNKSLISQYKSGIMLMRRNYNRNSAPHEVFRLRNNTSRPPSLHVDDFVLLQERGQQPTGPTGYNRQSLRAARELMEARHSGAIPRQRQNRLNVQRTNRP